MKAINLLFILMLNFFFQSQGQKVESSSYSLMLSSLLSHSVTEISAKEIDANKENLIFIDSREKEEYEVSHIKDAIWVGYDSLDFTNVDCLDKNSRLIVYCSVGYRSEKVAEKLKAKGFTNVSNLYGGIFEWKNQGYEVVDEKNQPTDSVHAYNKVWGIWLNKGVKVY